MTVHLRPLEEADLRRIYDWQRDPALYDHLVGAQRDVGWTEARDWMARHWLPQGPDHRYALCAGSDQALIGCVYLLPTVGAPGALEFHIFIGDPAWRGRGLGAKGLAEALRVAFDDLDAETVRLEVLETNAPARRVYRAAGFEEIGCRVVDKRGGPVSAIAMQLARAAYRAR